MKTIIFLLCLLPFTYPLCAFTGMPTGLPPKKNRHPAPPVLYSDPNEPCPYYTGKPVCCNHFQQMAMRTNFFVSVAT